MVPVAAVLGRVARALPLLALLACGARSELDSDGVKDDYALALPPHAAPAVGGCTPPTIVPHGRAWVGMFLINAAGLSSLDSFDNPNCYVGGGMPAHPFAVAAFFLDVDEATNGCYQHCVRSGACAAPVPIEDSAFPSWDDPGRSDWPVIVDHARAEAFCGWRRGRLPSAAELTRASHGDAESIAGPGFIEQWRLCFNQKFESPECQRLHARALPDDHPVEPIRSYPDDQGPFGHFDLFGSQADLTLSLPPRMDAEHTAYCAYAVDAPDPKTFGTPGADPLWFEFSPSESLLSKGDLINAKPAGWNAIVSAVRVDRDALGRRHPYVQGVRCAYDPER